MNIKSKAFACYVFSIFVFFMLCGGCATEIVLKIQEGTSFAGNKLFHAATGAICLILIMRLAQAVRT
jgi:hypothetical protein